MQHLNQGLNIIGKSFNSMINIFTYLRLELIKYHARRYFKNF